MLEKEELARQRVLDTPTHSPAYLRYVAQLNERTALKHEIMDAPTVEAKPVIHGEWERILYSFVGGYRCSCCGWKSLEKHLNFRPDCGADMRKRCDR